ncbi:MAG: hypothetical protein ACKOHH_03535, partial [Bacteroidota bacterium]
MVNETLSGSVSAWSKHGHQDRAPDPWQDGVVVRQDSLGYPRLGMTCQGSGARSWWPCLDHA